MILCKADAEELLSLLLQASATWVKYGIIEPNNQKAN
jgi:hypothetical protein